MTNEQSAWDQWLASLPPQQRAAAIALRNRFARLGADRPEEWAQSELFEHLPQLARFLLLRRLWNEAINSWENQGAVENVPAAARLLAAGADRADVVLTMRAAAFEAVFATLTAIDEGGSTAPGDQPLPGWSLHETDAVDHHTRQRLGGLHESLGETDPSGHQAQDLWT
ncbi:hypothetical protein [Actinomadura kijaniata]|uniref:hypothetical protein n=1 Tax=Actinomadura kijaniata TaxID=46161 RepID=UPI000AC334F8|nr:hypothetical protein [Actinomadura kijaniata]